MPSLVGLFPSTKTQRKAVLRSMSEPVSSEPLPVFFYLFSSLERQKRLFLRAHGELNRNRRAMGVAGTRKGDLT